MNFAVEGELDSLRPRGQVRSAKSPPGVYDGRTMQRRRFLRTTFTGGLAVGGSACAPGSRGASQAPLGEQELERRLGRLDRTLARMNHASSRDWFLRRRKREARDPARRERLQLEGDLMRASLRSALVTSTIAELPEANRHDPRVLERLRKVSGEADFAVFGMVNKLRAMSPEERAQFDAHFGDEPKLGARVVEQVDELASAYRVPVNRRLHLRQLANHVGWRMQRERFSSLADQLIARTDETVGLAARRMAELEARGPTLSSLADGDPGWIQRTREAVAFYAGESRVDALIGVESPAASGPPAQPDPKLAEEYGRATRLRNAGAGCLGAGVGLFVLGSLGAFLGGSFPLFLVGAVAMTVGGILLVVGLVLLAVGQSRMRRFQPE